MAGVNGIIGPILPHPPALKYPVDASGKSNDSAQKISSKGRIVTISGVAKNDGRNPSVATFEVSGQTYRVPTKAGMTPLQLAKALNKKLPSDLSVQVLTAGKTVTLNVMRGPPKEQVDVPNLIRRTFAEAGGTDTQGGNKMSKGELHKAFALALDDKRMTAAERQALAGSWAALFNGNDFVATAGAKEEFARLSKKHKLPQLGID